MSDVIQIEPSLPLTFVSVLRNSALFKHVGIVSLSKGTNEIRIKHLTKNLDKDSIRLRGKGPGKIINVLPKKKFLKEASNEKITELIHEKEKILFKIREINDNLAIQDIFLEGRKISFTTFSRNFPRSYSRGEISIDSIMKLKGQIEDEIIAALKSKREYEKTLKELKKELDKIEREIRQLQDFWKHDDRSEYEILAVIEANEDAEFIIELTYVVMNAYWIPVYDILIKEDGVDIEFYANIYNSTGVDWQNVSLKVSTGSATMVKAIEPKPFYISEYIPEPPRIPAPSPHFHVRAAKKMAAAPASPAIEMEKSFEAEIEQMAEEMEDLNVASGDMQSTVSGIQVYELEEKYTIPSSKNPKPVLLSKNSLKSRREYFWSSEFPDTLLCYERVKNGENILLPGKAKIYVGDEFIGSTFLEEVLPNEELRIGERISYDVKVRKKLKSRTKQKEGAFKGKNMVSYQYEIKIENLSQVKEKLILYDVIPYSYSEKIKVKLGHFSLSPTSNNLNVLKFEIDLKDVKDTLIITYSYDVVYEKGVQIEPPLP